MDNRRHQRIDSENLLSYVCLDNNNETVQQGMGKTLNVSEGGILLETHVPIDPELTILLGIGFENEMADIRGGVIHSRTREDGMMETGINFEDMTGESKAILTSFIKNFHQRQGDSQ